MVVCDCGCVVYVCLEKSATGGYCTVYRILYRSGRYVHPASGVCIEYDNICIVQEIALPASQGTKRHTQQSSMTDHSSVYSGSQEGILWCSVPSPID